MSAITDLLQEKAGLSPEKSIEVEKIIVDHITAQVPPQYQAMLGPILGVAPNAASTALQAFEEHGLGGLLEAVNNVFGSKKN